MERYSFSLHGHARHVHLGSPVPACGERLPLRYGVSDEIPSGMTLCPRCVARGTSKVKVVVSRPAVAPTSGPRMDVLLELLKSGELDAVIAHNLGTSIRTVTRMVAARMRADGARSRFQWGYRLAHLEAELAQADAAVDLAEQVHDRHA